MFFYTYLIPCSKTLTIGGLNFFHSYLNLSLGQIGSSKVDVMPAFYGVKKGMILYFWLVGLWDVPDKESFGNTNKDSHNQE